MIRKLVLGLLVAVAAIGVAGSASAAHISKNNPYRSFNVSGINYGSMNWEHQHHQHRNVRSGGLFRGR